MARLGNGARLAAALAAGALIGGCTSPPDTPEQEPVWTAALPHPPEAVDIAGDHVVVVSENAVVSLDRATGEPAWTRSPLEAAQEGGALLPELRILPEQTAIAGDHVVVAMTMADPGDPGYQLYEILDLRSGTPTWRYELNSAGGGIMVTRRSLLAVTCPDVRGPCRIASLDVATGADQWSQRFEGGASIVGTPRRHHVGAFAVPDPPVIPVLQLPRDPSKRARVTGLDPRTGRPLMTVATPFRGNLEGLQAGRDNSLQADGVLVLSHPQDDVCRAELRGFDLQTGEPRWRTTVGTYQSGDLTGVTDGEECGGNLATEGTPIGTGTLLAGTEVAGAPQLLDLTEGTPRWTGKPGGVVVDTDGTTVVVRTAAESGQLLVRALGSGRSWTLPNPDPDGSVLEALDVVVTDGQVIVSRPSGEGEAGNEVIGHDAASGRGLWTAPDSGDILAAGQGWVICRESSAEGGPGANGLRLFRL